MGEVDFAPPWRKLAVLYGEWKTPNGFSIDMHRASNVRSSVAQRALPDMVNCADLQVFEPGNSGFQPDVKHTVHANQRVRHCHRMTVSIARVLGPE